MREQDTSMGFRMFAAREVICLQSGRKIGYADDILFDPKQAKLTGVVIYGRNRWFSAIDDLFIPWEEVKLIGEDTLLVGRADKMPPIARQRSIGLFGRLTALLKKDG